MKKNPGSLSEGNLNTDSMGFKIPPGLLVKKTMKHPLLKAFTPKKMTIQDVPCDHEKQLKIDT